MTVWRRYRRSGPSFLLTFLGLSPFTPRAQAHTQSVTATQGTCPTPGSRRRPRGPIVFVVFLIAVLLTLNVAPLAQVDQAFVIVGREGVWIRQGATIASGDIAANAAKSGTFLHKGVEVSIEERVRLLDPTSRMFGARVHLKPEVQVFDVATNDLRGPGQVQGQQIPLDTPDPVSAFPPVLSFTPGTRRVHVPKNGSLSLGPGRYGRLTVDDGATLMLTGGEYTFQSWSLEEFVHVYVEAPSEIRIAGRLRVEDKCFVGPAPKARIGASDIVIFVTGINGTTGGIEEGPIAAEFGTHTTTLANVFAPNGTLRIRERSKAMGAFLGKWVRVEEWVSVLQDSAFGLGR